MHDIFSREPDPLDGMLAPLPLPPDAEALRQKVYAQTSRVLRRRRRLWQCAYAAGLAASFAIGLLVMRASIRPIPTDSGERGRVSAPSTQALGTLTRPRPPVPADESALAREVVAFDSLDQRGELYRQAGDRYMEEESDPQSALRCYANALDNVPKQEQAISSDDNWLLMAIKNARQKEKDHAKNGG